ncbi:MAG: rhamnulokinase [Clostridiales bacterium]|nr:rhamnulokinase [Clostridiales bacterium]
MQKYYLAIDIGASSGRHILGTLKNGKIQLEEIYRFENGLEEKNGHLCWDLERLFNEIVNGLKECKRLDKIPTTMGIDTWAVDFVLLDNDGKILGDTVAYRDNRTTGMDQKVYEKISLEDLYARTGIQKQMFNSIYQLMAIKETTPELMENAESLLMIPDYFNYLLTGEKCSEYTNATTTQLVNINTNDWDHDLIETLGYKKEIFEEISLPKTVVGKFKKEIEDEVGFSCNVVLPATHDTASAVLAVPSNDDDYIYISSGTWSLLGIESFVPNTSKLSMENNYTNEGGYEYRYRYLKNIMGLWMIQCVKKELDNKYSFAKLCEIAADNDEFTSIVNVYDDTFLAPESMIGAIKKHCRDTNQAVPSTDGELAACVYKSLAVGYTKAVKEIEEIMNKTYSKIYIVGGGSNAEYLNELTAKMSGKELHVGLSEATSMGNVLAQMLGAGEFNSLAEARECVYLSSDIKKIS